MIVRYSLRALSLCIQLHCSDALRFFFFCAQRKQLCVQKQCVQLCACTCTHTFLIIRWETNKYEMSYEIFSISFCGSFSFGLITISRHLQFVKKNMPPAHLWTMNILLFYQIMNTCILLIVVHAKTLKIKRKDIAICGDWGESRWLIQCSYTPRIWFEKCKQTDI